MTFYTADEATGFAATLTPWAARILVFLFLQERGASYTGKELAARFGVSEQTISAAVTNLEASGFVQNNGKFNGWSLLPEHYQPKLIPGHRPQGQAGSELVQKFLNQPEVSSKIFESSPPLLVVDDLTLNSEREDQQQSIKSAEGSKFFELSPDHSGTKQRAQILRQYGVSGRAIRRYSHPPCPETAVILAFCWESATMPLNNPGGWINCRLRDGDEPGDDHLDLARFWLALDAGGRADFNAVLDAPSLENWTVNDLVSGFEISQAAAELAVQLRGLKAFEEATQ